MSTVYNCAKREMRQAGLDAAYTAVKAGQLVVLPTDTVYGIGCDAANSTAVMDLLNTKGRGPDMPVPILLGSWDGVDKLVFEMTEDINNLIRAFWPGGLSIVVRQSPSLLWKLGDAEGTVMLRMPLQVETIELLRRTGPMAVSSANKTRHAPAHNITDAQSQLGEDIAVYLDAGTSAIGVPSSIIDLSGERPRLIRDGAISAEDIATVLGIEAAELRLSE